MIVTTILLGTKKVGKFGQLVETVQGLVIVQCETNTQITRNRSNCFNFVCDAPVKDENTKKPLVATQSQLTSLKH